MKIIDLRSDTVTRPTPAMRQAMAHAEVDDDVIDADPTVKRLQDQIAERLGKEAAMFMPSGTMTNQVALRYHTRSGDEFLCEEGCHIFQYEQGGFAQLSQLVARTVGGRDGVLQLDQLKPLVRPDDEHAPVTRLVCLENTHNRGGGRVLPYDGVVEICDWARQLGLATHLDGARLFNAAVSSGVDADQWAQHFDTVSVCFSKGLGAPVGSALVGPKAMVHEVRRHRKLFGGGMRQAGIIAAGALHALENHVDRLRQDHDHAQHLARTITETEGLKLTQEQVDTNIVFFAVEPQICSAARLCEALAKSGVLMLALGENAIRAVTHLDVTQEDMEEATRLIRDTTANMA